MPLLWYTSPTTEKKALELIEATMEENIFETGSEGTFACVTGR